MSEPDHDFYEEDVNPRKRIDYKGLQVPVDISPGEYLGGDLLDPEKFPEIETPPKQHVTEKANKGDSDGDLTPVYEANTPSPNQAKAPEKRENTVEELQMIIAAQ